MGILARMRAAGGEAPDATAAPAAAGASAAKGKAKAKAKAVVANRPAAAMSNEAKRLAKGKEYADAYDAAYDRCAKAGKDHLACVAAAQRAGQAARLVAGS